ncbi:transketolase [Candidatus Viridilinea mediisalina]|uniref:Transketolase n=1 Tax=Candidatus Viridilinea mediisalina TaxID=2024553 RepID=A0A2A6RK32_9CHLR|nr:transketolase [Candidatus Viridilinea mediisalina]PDW03230.1 transketolase [Candidatus Viridilinea mediisalina]
MSDAMTTAEVSSTELDRMCANAIRALAVDAVQRANSGHPGMPLGAADAAYVLWTRFLKHNPEDPNWINRDRFVLSAGHASMLLYALLHLSGYDLSLDDLRNFRQWGSRTPGHPEYHETAGVEMTTGPLGQGIATAVGMALAERWLAEKFNRPGFPVVDHHTYVICSDGDLMEGIAYEAASMAGHLALGKLIVLYDSNSVSIDGATDITFSENVAQRFRAAAWRVQQVDGHDMAAVAQALAEAIDDPERPALIIARTTIGHGSPNKAGTNKCHGEPLGASEAALTKQALGWPLEPEFFVPEEVYEHMQLAVEVGNTRQQEWTRMFERYCASHPELAAQWQQMQERAIPQDWSILPEFAPNPKDKGTRVSAGVALNTLAEHVPSLIGGSADLSSSNNTLINGATLLEAHSFVGRNISFGVREHAMGAILNGLALHGGFIPFGGTFLVFSDYMRPAIRMAALMRLQVVYVFTHDSIGLGEDGPTHQPVEHVMSLRLIPNLYVFRAGDGNEAAMGWRMALERRDGPTALIFTRQGVPTLDRSPASGLAPASAALRGAYVLRDVANPQIALLATGSELSIALDAAFMLEERGIAARVVSMPCWERFEEQDAAYRESVLPANLSARVAVEAGRSLGWERYVGMQGTIVGVDRFGASAPHTEIFARMGITAEAVVAAALRVLA